MYYLYRLTVNSSVKVVNWSVNYSHLNSLIQPVWLFLHDGMDSIPMGQNFVLVACITDEMIDWWYKRDNFNEQMIQSYIVMK